MIIIPPPINDQLINFLRFVDCCTGAEIYFRGSLPINDGDVYLYIGATPFPGENGTLDPNRCYTIFQDYTSDPITYPPAPTLGVLSFKDTLGCEDPSCPDCTPTAYCECPKGFIEVDGECVKTTSTTAVYSGGLLTVTTGSKSTAYSNFGLRLYPDISGLTWPLLGNGPTMSTLYEVKQNNGAGAVVTQIADVQNTLWGSYLSGCATGSTGGRLNISGVWAPGTPPDQELSFEFCITVDGEATKQYTLGIAGDNYVKFYIDNVLAVFLDAADSGVTRPFNSWHVFPITLTPGTHTIKVSGLNIGYTPAAFGAEIYDLTLAELQANFTAPAVSSGNCGTPANAIDPYIIFSTKDYIGQQIPDPTQPGVWTCPDGSEVDYCNGVPTCTITEKIVLVCDCYLIIPCDGTAPFTTNNQDFAQYDGSFITVDSANYTGCAYITKLEDTDCNEAVDALPVEIPCECDSQCYYIANTNGFVYVDENNILQEVSAIDAAPYIKVCSKVPPIPENSSVNYQIVNLGLCELGVCPTQCFKLTNCDDPTEVIHTISDSLLPYVYGTNNVVRILGKEGCWIASLLDPEEVCDCAIDVVISASYITCEDCKGYTAYKLTSCIGNDVIYTLVDLEPYLGQVIKTNCGCFTIEQINYLPPNPQIIIVEDTYTKCIECTRSYWKLEDCLGQSESIITYTDLSAYEGQVIKIENCPECWTVTPTEEHLNASIVTVAETYEDCATCTIDVPCVCTNLVNAGSYPRTYEYIDCDKQYNQITLLPGESTGKVCALKWNVVPYCQCFMLEISIETSPGVFTVTTYGASIIEGQFLNNYPVYQICITGQCGTASFNGTNWIIYDSTGVGLYMLSDNTSSTCPFGTWLNFDGTPIVDTTISSYVCADICYCVNITVNDGQGTESQLLFTFTGYDQSGYPVYTSLVGDTITFDALSNCWTSSVYNVPFTLCDNIDCPTGNGTTQITGWTFTSVVCTPPSDDFLFTDYFETFGNCQNGVCPPPVFKNNRTVKPGYNTPICTAEKYDMITCRFADILYKIALEKRYGISNCCPEDDDRWLTQKELIDLQALKDPNYNCQPCTCSCTSSCTSTTGNTCSTCNCKN